LDRITKSSQGIFAGIHSSKNPVTLLQSSSFLFGQDYFNVCFFLKE